MPVAVRRDGTGPEVLLVHGGASPETTWAGLEPLRDRFTLASVYRRGFPPSPDPDGRQDFAVDADDLKPLLEARPHVVAHSYGTLGALIAAGRRPPRSLTLIESPLYHLVPDDPEVERFRGMGDTFLAQGLDSDPAMLREFLLIAGSPVPDEGPLPAAVVRAVQRAQGGRPPSEARPDLAALRGVRTLVASGNHHPVVERMCDALAAELGAERVIAPGAGHFVAKAPGFAARLERFLR